jgi:ribosomal protein S18 acetylase RimI-like enzyme
MRCGAPSSTGDVLAQGLPVSSFELRRARPGDIPALVALQLATLSESRVTQLGPGFLRDFYRAALAHPGTITLVAVGDDGQPIGAVLASSDVDGFNKFVGRRVLLSLLRAFVQPSRWYLLPKFALRLLERDVEPHIPAELILLFVAPDTLRQGLGRKLVSTLEEEFRNLRVAVYRVAVRSQLKDAQAFYRALGFTYEQELRVLGEPMVYFLRSLRD